LAFLLLAVAGLAAIEYDVQPGGIRAYAWQLTQSTQWTSAGETLRYETSMRWELGLRCTAVDAAGVHLNAIIVTVAASHRGPGVAAEIDSAKAQGVDDPLLGHLLELAGRSLALTVDPRTGRVAKAEGGDAIIAAINQRAPAAVPGDPPPFDAQARAAFSPEALARLWSQVLALPGADEQVPLPPPFAAGASFARRWKAQAWTAEMPQPVAFELAKDPTPVRGTVRDLAGGGEIALAKGLPTQAQGRLAFTLAIDALTQAVESRHEVRWSLTALTPP
jgi:hypothetical protein